MYLTESNGRDGNNSHVEGIDKSIILYEHKPAYPNDNKPKQNADGREYFSFTCWFQNLNDLILQRYTFCNCVFLSLFKYLKTYAAFKA